MTLTIMGIIVTLHTKTLRIRTFSIATPSMIISTTTFSTTTISTTTFSMTALCIRHRRMQRLCHFSVPCCQLQHSNPRYQNYELSVLTLCYQDKVKCVNKLFVRLFHSVSETSHAVIGPMVKTF